MKILLTDRFLRAIKPTSQRQIIWDTSVPSFCVIVTAKGKINFGVIRRLPGQRVPKTRVLGQYPIMALAAARETAREALADIANGVDPKGKQEAERRAEAQRSANSFASVAEEFIGRHVRKLRSGADVEATIRREMISRWGEKPFVEISRRDIVQAVEQIADSGRLHIAHHVFSYVSKLFSWAITRGLCGLEVSPCAGIKRSEILGAREARHRVLNEAEIRALWRATEDLGYPLAPFVRLLLLTGQRLREVSEMSWSELDLEKGVWTITRERMKRGAAHEVPLPATAIEIVRSLPRWPGPYVFSTTGGKWPISGFSKMKIRLGVAMPDIASWRFHDLRRTMRTGLSALPIPSTVCELCIGHTQPGLHKVYDLHSYRDEKRRAFELWAARLAEIVEPGEAGNVIPLPARA
jgi:integrase